jgi:hypothetical protein
MQAVLDPMGRLTRAPVSAMYDYSAYITACVVTCVSRDSGRAGYLVMCMQVTFSPPLWLTVRRLRSPRRQNGHGPSAEVSLVGLLFAIPHLSEYVVCFKSVQVAIVALAMCTWENPLHVLNDSSAWAVANASTLWRTCTKQFKGFFELFRPRDQTHRGYW